MIHRLIWLSEGLSHFITVHLLRHLTKQGYAKALFLCGPPRCGTSWISDVLAFYYNLPRPKHYKLPLLFDAVIHTHLIQNYKCVGFSYYVKRNGLDAYLSRYLQLRDDLLSHKKFVGESRYRKEFKDVSLEENISNNVKVLIKMDLSRKKKNSLIHSLAKIEYLHHRHGGIIIDYDLAQNDAFKEFASAIKARDGNVNSERLQLVLRLLSKEQQRRLKPYNRSTHINENASVAEQRLSKELVSYYTSLMNSLINRYKS